MAQFTTLTSRVLPLPVNDIDTDQIIPARFLKATDKKGMGDNLFADWRYNADGSPKADFVLNQPNSKGAQVLLAGDNFGCGSSREHAPWALTPPFEAPTVCMHAVSGSISLPSRGTFHLSLTVLVRYRSPGNI